MYVLALISVLIAYQFKVKEIIVKTMARLIPNCEIRKG